jgi:quinoprotein dehydrogenase-associated probable ABC transporter substrate-binding protein
MAISANRGCMLLGSAMLCMALVAAGVERSRAQGAGLDAEFELVDPKVLRVCADPRNLPFSSEKGEGFENKIAELLAAKLDKKLAYVWHPQATGFVRNTLGAHRCDLIPGFPQGDELVQSTNPYYRTAYALVIKPGTGLDDLDALTDPRLKEKRIGIVAGTPPATYLAVNGLMRKAKPYPLVIDTRVDSSAQAMMADLASGEIDVGVLWGPMAGYYAKQADPPMRVVLLLKETGGPQLAFRIAMGVRAADQNWKRQLNKLIADNQTEINRLLLGFGVPLLDEKNQPITVDAQPR